MYGRAPPPPPPVENGIPPLPSSRPIRSIPIPSTPSASASASHTLVSPSTTSHLISPQNATSSTWLSSPLNKYHDHSSSTILPSTYHKPTSRWIRYKRHIIIGAITVAIIVAIVIGVVVGTSSSSSSSPSSPILNANNNNNNGAQGNTQIPATTSIPTSTPSSTSTTPPLTTTPPMTTSPPMTMKGLQFQLSMSASGVVDISNNKFSTSITPTAATGMSVIMDPVGSRGYVLQRTRSGTSTVGLTVSGATLGTSYTKSTWIYLYDRTNYPNFMASIAGNGEIQGHLFMAEPNGYLYAGNNMGTGADSRYGIDDSATKIPLPLSTWIHVAVTYNGDTGVITLYRNGIQTAQKIPTTAETNWKLWTGGLTTQIGTWAIYGMNGCISDMMQFTVALSNTEIQTLYQSQIRTGPSQIVPTSSPIDVTPKPVQSTSAPNTNTGVTSAPVVATRAPTTDDAIGSHGIAYNWGGQVMSKPVTVYLVFYGNWPANHPAIKYIPQFVQDLNGSPYWGTAMTYYSYNNATKQRTYVTSSVTLGATAVIAPYEPYIKTTITDAEVFYIIKGAILGGKLGARTTIDMDAVYLLMTSSDILNIGQCTKTCGWHTSAGGMKYGWVGDSSIACPKNCQPGVNTPNDKTADSMISMVAHELIEAVTAPNVDSWSNPGTVENADLCAWKFGTTYAVANGGTANLKMNGHDYFVQQIWVNKNGGYCGMSA